MISFADLFAGIGGFHVALHQLDAICVYSCEINDDARKTYIKNFSDINPNLFHPSKSNFMFKKDITLQENRDCIPLNIDILCAGFPCQSFSNAGKKLGFEDTRGQLFFTLSSIIKQSQPKSFLLENSSYLLNHNKGETFKIMKESLEDAGYKVYFQKMKASDYGLPTFRPRLYIVGLRNDISSKDLFKFPDKVPLKFTLNDVFKGQCEREIGYTIRVSGRHSGIGDKRNWDTYIVDGKEHILTIEEAKKMMGFPDWFKFPVSDYKAMKQLGNSVAIDVVKMIAEQIIKVLSEPMQYYLEG